VIDKRFLFNSDIVSPLILRSKVLRSEVEYDQDRNPERTALQVLKRFVQCVDKKIYLVAASQGAELPGKVRTYKGLLWNYEDLKLLEHNLQEVEVRDGRTRLVAVIDLRDFSYSNSENLLLSWTSTFLMISEKTLSDISRLAKK